MIPLPYVFLAEIAVENIHGLGALPIIGKVDDAIAKHFYKLGLFFRHHLVRRIVYDIDYDSTLGVPDKLPAIGT